MPSLFNPWVLLSLICAFLGFGYESYLIGIDHENKRQQLEIAALNADARQKEQALVSAVNTQAIKLQKDNNDAKVQIKKRDADIVAGVMRLRVPVSCPVQAAGDAPAAAGTDSGSAELQPETARAVLAVGDDADQTARKLATCVTLYNQVRETLKGKP